MKREDPDLYERELDALRNENRLLRQQLAEGERFAAAGVSTPVGHAELFAAIEKTRMPMILTDPNSSDDPIIFANRAFQQLTGYASHEVVGRNCRFLQGEGTDPSQVARLRQALQSNTEIVVELVNYRRDGSSFLNELYVSPIFDESGRLIYRFASQFDITQQRRTSRDLARMQRRTRAIFDGSIAVAIVVADENGLITDWNRGAEHLLGWTLAQMRGRHLSTLLTAADQANGYAETEMKTAAAAGQFLDERWHVRKDGGRLFAATETVPLFEGQERQGGFIKILRDKTAEYESGLVLAQTQDQLRRAQQAGGVGMFWIDIAEDVLHTTPEFCRLFGLPNDATMPASVVEDLTVADDRDLVSNPERRRTGVLNREVEYRIRRPDTGEIRWLARKAEFERDEAGKPIRLQGAVIDVTDRMSAQHSLLEEREQLALLFEQSPTFIGLLRGPEHHIERVNSRYMQLVGERDVLGRRVADALPDAVEQGFLELLDEVYRTGEPYVANAVRYVVQSRADGPKNERFVDFVYQPFRDSAGKVSGILSQGTDVTERTRAAADLKRGERHRKLLLELSDRIRDTSDAVALIVFAARLLAMELEVERVGYGTVDTAKETIVIEGEHDSSDIAPLRGTLRFRDYGSHIENLKRGETVVVDDTVLDPRTRDANDNLHAIATRAFVNIPMIEHGRFVAVIYATHSTARSWSKADVSLLGQVGERLRLANERLRSETALRASEEQFRVFAQAVPNHIWACDAAGRIDWFNQQVYAYAGMDALEGVESWDAFIHPDDLASSQAAWHRALEVGAVFEAEYRLRRYDGVYRWFLVRAEPVHDDDGAITRWVGTNTDVEDQRQQALELARLNSMLGEEVQARTRERDQIWQATTDMLCVANFEGYFVSLNPAWSAVLGWSDEEIKARPFLDFVHPDDRAATTEAAAGLSRGEPQLTFENRYRRKDGKYRWFSWNAVPRDGRIYGTVRDVTALKEQAAALAAAEDALRQSHKMEAVGQLTGGLAHDFNNLLTGITGSLDLISTRIAQGRFHDIERYAAAAQGAAKRAASLTHRLLAFSRRQTLDPKPTDVNRLVAGLEDLVRRTVGPSIEVENVAAGGLWLTLVDPNQLENALLNLCINARDAMPDGGRLTVETSNRWLDARAARERELSPGQYVSLCVSDTGCGMPPDVAAKAFDPFFTTKPLGQGTGLGLSMIYGFARQSGGQVRIYSEPGNGTMVCIYLPRHLGTAETAESSLELSDAPRAGAGETVLVVDDEPTVRMLVSEVLEELGYAAIEASDGASGLKILQSETRIDLVVTDVGMPGGMNGRQMADAARLSRPFLKVLFITGFAENAVLNNGQLARDMHVMTKPFSMEALASRIKDLISTG